MIKLLNITKRIIAVMLILMIMTVPIIGRVYADDADGTPVFGNGYNNMVSSDAHVVGVLSAIFSVLNVRGSSTVPAGSNIPATEYWSRRLLKAVHTVNQGTYDWIAENTEFELRNGKGVVKFLHDKTLQDVDGLDALIQFLFGTAALTGDPFSTEIVTDGTVTIDGEEVIPWVYENSYAAGTQGSSWASRSLNPSLFSSRGSYLIPMNGAYGSAWQKVYDYGAPYAYSGAIHTYTVTKPDGSTYTLGGGSFKATQGTGWKRLIFQTAGNGPVWQVTDTNENLVFAYIPVIDSQSHLCLALYSYIYSGEEIPDKWTNNYAIVWVSRNSGIVQLNPDSGATFVFESPGIEDPAPVNEIETNATTINEITNKYFNNTLIINTGGDSEPGGTVPDWGTDPIDFPGINLPDFDIDWSISGLKDKFPFSIPWDVMAFLAILNAEPITPEIHETVTLGAYDWVIDWDFHSFDDTAELLRNCEFVLFCIGLILSTRSLMGDN